MRYNFGIKRFEKFITVNRWHYKPIAEKIRTRNNQILKGVKFNLLLPVVNCQ